MVIEVQGLSRRFGATTALDGADLSVASGEVHAVVGGAGSGKSTLLRILAGIIGQDSGTASIDGLVLPTDSKRVRASVGWTSGPLNGFDALCTREVLTFVAHLHRIPAATAEQRISHLLNNLGLAIRAEVPLRRLSFEERVLVNLARAMLPTPRTMLLYLPATALTLPVRQDLHQMVREMADSGGTVLLASRSHADIANVADATTVLSKGRTPSEQELRDLIGNRRRWRIQTADPDMLRIRLNRLGVGARELPIRDSAAGSADVVIDLRDHQDPSVVLRGLLREGVPITAFTPADSAAAEFLKQQSS